MVMMHIAIRRLATSAHQQQRGDWMRRLDGSWLIRHATFEPTMTLDNHGTATAP